MASLQSRYHPTNQLIANNKLNLPLLDPLNPPRLTNKRLTPVQRPKLTRSKHLPRTVVIVTDPPATGSEYSLLDHLDMTVGNKNASLYTALSSPTHEHYGTYASKVRLRSSLPNATSSARHGTHAPGAAS